MKIKFRSALPVLAAVAATALVVAAAVAQNAPQPAAAPAASPPAVTAAPPAAVSAPVPAPAVSAPVPAPATGVEADLLIAAESAEAEEAPAEEEAKKAKAELISISLDNVPLEDVVRMFTRITDANIIAVATNLEGTVTVNLSDVQWEPALRAILDMHNLTLVEKTPGTGVYSIIPKPPGAPEPMEVETIFLRYATVAEVAPALHGILAPGGMLTPFPSRNAMVIRSTDANLGQIKQIIEKLDLPAKQVCVETKFMELDDTASEKLGLRWDSLDQFGVKLGLGPFTRTENTTSGRTKENTRTRWDRRQNLDTKNDRYDLDNVAYEESTTTYEESPPGSGNWVANTVVTPTRTVTDTIDTGEDNESTIVDTFAKTIVESQAAILTLDSFNVVLSALRKMDGVTVVSNPKIIVANGATNAQFSVGEREPIIRKDIQRGTTDSPGDIVTARLDTDINTDQIRQGYLSTGIELQVIPTVKTDDMIEAEIRPSLKRKTGDKEFEGNTWPIVSVKEIRTRFTLRSGQTVAIGGLTDTQAGPEARQQGPPAGRYPPAGQVPVRALSGFHAPGRDNHLRDARPGRPGAAEPRGRHPRGREPRAQEAAGEQAAEGEEQVRDGGPPAGCRRPVRPQVTDGEVASPAPEKVAR